MSFSNCLYFLRFFTFLIKSSIYIKETKTKLSICLNYVLRKQKELKKEKQKEKGKQKELERSGKNLCIKLQGSFLQNKFTILSNFADSQNLSDQLLI